GKSYIRTEDILEALRREGESIALVLIRGIHYYTGQLFDIETITRGAHEQYLNSGAGCIGGLFIHSNHFQSNLFKLNGWWGNRDFTSFVMGDVTAGGGFGLPSVPSVSRLTNICQKFETHAIVKNRKIDEKERFQSINPH
ncbi:unnamed protein product, partial [Didymodactylos carnosus]